MPRLAEVMKFYTRFWTKETFSEKKRDGHPLEYLASNSPSVKKINYGDILYVLGEIGGQLRLAGKMQVGRLCRQDEAAQILNRDPQSLWGEEADYLIASNATIVDLNRILPPEVAKSLEFVGKRRKLTLLKNDKIESQSIRALRELTPESAALFDSYLPPMLPIQSGLRLPPVLNLQNDLQKTGLRNWSVSEIDVTIQSYFKMLIRELRGESYNKTEYRRDLRRKVNERTEASIELKHQNISAILAELNFAYIDGYKPRGNYQDLLFDRVVNFLDGNSELRMEFFDAFESAPSRIGSFTDPDLFVDPPNVLEFPEKPINRVTGGGAPVDFAAIDARNRALGYMGEEFVFKLEVERLTSLGREGLSKQVEWTAREYGPAAGYDIKSYTTEGEEIYIEVKTTNGGMRTPFLITANEVRASEMFGSAYRLYRVFSYATHPKIYVLHGVIKSTCSLEPQVFKAFPSRSADPRLQ